jgi:hypothetical protein
MKYSEEGDDSYYDSYYEVSHQQCLLKLLSKEMDQAKVVSFDR